MSKANWKGRDAGDIEHELGLDDECTSGVFELRRRKLEEPSLDKPPTWCPALAFGVWPPIWGPDGEMLRSKKVIDDQVVIAITREGFACAARAETAHGHNRWYRWLINKPQMIGRRSAAHDGYHETIYGRTPWLNEIEEQVQR